jgi:hypothetical protein
MTGAVQAQEHQPYAGHQTRPLKALSAQQIDDLRMGRGMGLALAAELNGYPGPVHVLELGESLNLSASQRSEMERLDAAMKAEAISLGERLLAEEAHLDRLFAARTVTPENLAAATGAIGATQAALRTAHLKYHLATTETLRPEQVLRYAELRGYGGAGGHSGGHN